LPGGCAGTPHDGASGAVAVSAAADGL